jgi:hypothetical protein
LLFIFIWCIENELIYHMIYILIFNWDIDMDSINLVIDNKIVKTFVFVATLACASASYANTAVIAADSSARHDVTNGIYAGAFQRVDSDRLAIRENASPVAMLNHSGLSQNMTPRCIVNCGLHWRRGWLSGWHPRRDLQQQMPLASWLALANTAWQTGRFGTVHGASLHRPVTGGAAGTGSPAGCDHHNT